MHRVLVVRLAQDSADKFEVIGDSSNPAASLTNPVSLPAAGGTAWAEFDDSTGYNSQYSMIPVSGTVTGAGYWRVFKTGNKLFFDYGKARAAERKVITSGELHIEYEGRHYSARAGDSILILTDAADRIGDEIRSFPVTFYGDSDCTAAFTDFAL